MEYCVDMRYCGAHSAHRYHVSQIEIHSRLIRVSRLSPVCPCRCVDGRRARVLWAARESCVRSVHGGTVQDSSDECGTRQHSDGCLVCIVDIGIDATTMSQLCVFWLRSSASLSASQMTGRSGLRSTCACQANAANGWALGWGTFPSPSRSGPR